MKEEVQRVWSCPGSVSTAEASKSSGAWPRMGLAALFWVGLFFLSGVRAEAQEQEPDSVQSATLRGQVVSAMTGGPLENAQVVLKRAGRGAVTNDRGRFVIRDVRGGMDTVQASLIGFAKEQVPLRLKGGHTTEATFMLSRTVLRIEDLRVTVDRPDVMGKLAGFMEREERGHGHFIGPQELEDSDRTDPSEVLRTVPGVRVGASRVGETRVIISRGQRGCEPFIWVDGQPLPDYHIDNLTVDDLIGVEVYRGVSEIPPQFNYRGNQCGVMVLWTREGNRERDSYR